MLGGEVHFNQHIHYEMKDGILHAWGMTLP